jgi:hypothetical protein
MTADALPVRRLHVTGFRNLLITAGAAFGSAFVVGALRWWMLYPLTGLGKASGAPEVALTWSIGVGVAVAVLAGWSAGVNVEAAHGTGWSLLLGALVALAAGTGFSRGVFSSAVTRASVELAVSAIAAITSIVAFHVTRGRVIRNTARAGA